MTKPRSVAILVPSDDHWQAATATSIIDMVRFSMANGVDTGVINWRGAMITAARNGLVRLIPKGCDAALWVDSDIAMPADALLRLLDHDKDIVGCFYNQRVAPYSTVGQFADPALNAAPPADGLHEAAYLPGGFVMVKKRVYDKLGWPWYGEITRWPGSAVESFCARLRAEALVRPPEEAIAALMSCTAFTSWLVENHAKDLETNPTAMISEDFFFSRLARNAGYKLWVDIDLTWQLAHMGVQPIQCFPPQAAQG
jgi:hypothetical protein